MDAGQYADAAMPLACDRRAHPVSRRGPGSGCARTPTQLAMDLRGALALGDVNRIAESYHWVGMSNKQGQRIMDRLRAADRQAGDRQRITSMRRSVVAVHRRRWRGDDRRRIRWSPGDAGMLQLTLGERHAGHDHRLRCAPLRGLLLRPLLIRPLPIDFAWQRRFRERRARPLVCRDGSRCIAACRSCCLCWHCWRCGRCRRRRRCAAAPARWQLRSSPIAAARTSARVERAAARSAAGQRGAALSRRLRAQPAGPGLRMTSGDRQP